ncbi:MAG: hypothetical protein ACFCVK_24880 [Acidimicrobiales bacterium]
MTNSTLSQVPPRWRRYFDDVLVAIRPVVSQPIHLRSALQRWADLEPVLVDVDVSQLFERPGQLTDPQVRALIRISRASEADAEAATWAVICQLLPAVAAAARAEVFSGTGSEGPRAAVNTAVAELWCHIQRINLDTNRASIFFALSSRVRHAARAAGPGRKSTYLLARSLVDPSRFTTDGDDDRPAPILPMRNRPPTSWLDPDPTWGNRPIEAAEWRTDVEGMVDHLTQFLTDDLIRAFDWDPHSCSFEIRRRRLADYLRARISAAATGTPITAAEIATEMGASYHTIRDLQKHVTRALHDNADRYRPHVLATLGAPAETITIHRQAA